MRAIAITPGKPGARLVERPEPKLQQADEIKLKVVQVGICGTDREEIAGGRALAPAGAHELVIGHEMIGRVVEVGAAVTRVHPSDHAVFTVRRPCGKCDNCGLGRNDMCQTGEYTERGIHGRDGYQAEFVVDREIHVTRVPEALVPAGVLLEPLSIVEKAIAESLRVQQLRNPVAAVTSQWFSGRRCLVAGLGPVGLLAALVLRLRGGEVFGLDILDAESARPAWLAAIGGRYLDGRQHPLQSKNYAGSMDMVVDASGFAALELELIRSLAPNAIFALTGIPGGDDKLSVAAAALLRQLVLENQVIVGSVNAARGHFEMAVDDLAAAEDRWPGHVATMITKRQTPEAFAAAARRAASGIKDVVAWE